MLVTQLLQMNENLSNDFPPNNQPNNQGEYLTPEEREEEIKKKTAKKPTHSGSPNVSNDDDGSITRNSNQLSEAFCF